MLISFENELLKEPVYTGSMFRFPDK